MKGMECSIHFLDHISKWLDKGLSIADPQLFKRDPWAMMKVFKYSAELRKEITVATQELIRSNLEIVDDGFRKSKEVNDCFLSLLRKGGYVAKVLKTMHRLGVLGRFIPEFGNIIHLPQSYHQHIYTTDLHTLFAIEEFENLLQISSTRCQRCTRAASRQWPMCPPRCRSPPPARLYPGCLTL